MNYDCPQPRDFFLTWISFLICIIKLSDKLSLATDNFRVQAYIFCFISIKESFSENVTKHFYLISCMTTFYLKTFFYCFFLTLFHSFVNSNRRNACSRSPEMHQQDNISSTWWLRITFPCQNGSSQVLHSSPWAPSLCTSRSLVRLSAQYGNQGSFIVFLILPGASKGRFALLQAKVLNWTPLF